MKKPGEQGLQEDYDRRQAATGRDDAFTSEYLKVWERWRVEGFKRGVKNPKSEA